MVTKNAVFMRSVAFRKRLSSVLIKEGICFTMNMQKKNTIDMTHGSLWNKLLLFALPLAASSILQQLFNSVDTAVVGRFASSRALAAVGSNS